MLRDFDNTIRSFFDELAINVPVNIIKTDKEYIIKTTIQSREYASVEVEQGKLKICTKYPESRNNDKYYVNEIVNGCRTFKFGDAAMDEAKAEMVNNLLQIKIPIQRELNHTRNVVIQ